MNLAPHFEPPCLPDCHLEKNQHSASNIIHNMNNIIISHLKVNHDWNSRVKINKKNDMFKIIEYLVSSMLKASILLHQEKKYILKLFPMLFLYFPIDN